MRSGITMRCPICNQILGSMTPSHVKKHGYKNTQEFFKDFPQFKVEVDRLNRALDMRATRFLGQKLKKGVQL